MLICDNEKVVEIMVPSIKVRMLNYLIPVTLSLKIYAIENSQVVEVYTSQQALNGA